MASKVNFGVIGAGGIARRRTIPGMLKAKNRRRPSPNLQFSICNPQSAIPHS